MKETQTLISKAFFEDICRFIDLLSFDLTGNEDSGFMELYIAKHDDYVRRLKTHVEAKKQAAIKRQLYTASKTAETSDERESARKTYIETVGIPESFRY